MRVNPEGVLQLIRITDRSQTICSQVDTMNVLSYGAIYYRRID